VRREWVRAAGADIVHFGEARPLQHACCYPLCRIYWQHSQQRLFCEGISVNLKLGRRERAVPSAVLETLREERIEALKEMDPGQRMEIAFALSLEAQKLFVAGMRVQGFSEAEIQAALKAKPR
jgi:hypothetical protein